jgi:histone H3/H4
MWVQIPLGAFNQNLFIYRVDMNLQGDFMSLIVRSKIKSVAKEVRISSDFYSALDKKVEEVVKEAVRRAKGNKRATIRAVDL